MRKFRKGFTLAEVLITLTIIGVVAALTAPALVNNAGFARVGPSLAKFVNTFEIATESMMHAEGTSVYRDSSNISTDIIMLAKYMNMIPYTGKQYIFSDAASGREYVIKSDGDYLAEIQEMMDTVLSGNNPNDYDITDIAKLNEERLNAATVWKLKNSEVMVVVPMTTTVSLSGKGAYKGIVAEVIVDIDGDKSNNRAGKDVFAFLLDKTGSLIPAGSMAHKYINQNGSKYVKEYSEVCSSSSQDLAENFACTGKIADNGWSANGLDIN